MKSPLDWIKNQKKIIEERENFKNRFSKISEYVQQLETELGEKEQKLSETESLFQDMISVNRLISNREFNPKFLKPIKTDKGLVIAHNDLDAVVASSLLKMAGYNTKTIFLNTWNWYEILEKVTAPAVFILDLFCDEKALPKIEYLSRNSKITYIDHHRSTCKIKNELLGLCYRLIVNPERCTSEIVFNLLEERFPDKEQARKYSIYAGIIENTICGLPISWPQVREATVLNRAIKLYSTQKFLEYVEKGFLNGSILNDPQIKQKSEIMDKLISHYSTILLDDIVHEDRKYLIIETDKEIVGRGLVTSCISQKTNKSVYLLSHDKDLSGNEYVLFVTRPLDIHNYLGEKRVFQTDQVEELKKSIISYGR